MLLLLFIADHPIRHDHDPLLNSFHVPRLNFPIALPRPHHHHPHPVGLMSIIVIALAHHHHHRDMWIVVAGEAEHDAAHCQ